MVENVEDAILGKLLTIIKKELKMAIDLSEFKPDFTPIEMMKMGVFGGAYFKEAKPEDFKGMNDSIVKMAKTQVGPFDAKNNKYGVKAGLPKSEWVKAGWIFPEDPLGWFQWYCRYYSGRRHKRDEYHIKKWINYKKRWKGRKKMSDVIRQGLIQWAIKP